MNAPYELREGIVRRVSRVSGRVAIVELRDEPGVIQLCIGRSWVLDRGDSVVFLGRQDAKTGKFLVPCYRNITRGVQDHRSPERTAMAYAIEGGLAVVAAFLFWNAGEFDSPVLWLPMGAVLLHMLVGAGGLIEDVRYSRALKRHAAALAVS